MHVDEAAAPAAWERLFAAGDEAGRIARHAALFWNDVIQALAPALGRDGALALFQRSVRLACPRHPGLGNAAATSPAGPFEPLREALAALPDADAADAATALARAFHQQLAGLLGTALSTRLLEPAWRAGDDPARRAPARPHAPSSTVGRQPCPDRTTHEPNHRPRR